MKYAGQFLAEAEQFDGFKKAVERRYGLEPGSRARYRLELYDTFDWRLYGKGFFAYSKEDSFVLERPSAAEPTLACRVGAMVPRFWWEFGDEDARSFLQGVIGIRALLLLMAVTVKEESFNVRNRDEKIVCRVSFLSCRPVGGSVRSFLLVRPLRGYGAESDRISSLTAKSGMAGLAVPLWEDLLRSGGHEPGGYSSKLDLCLDREMTISMVAVVINRRLLSTIRSNIQGVVEDYDTEFLHDLRVATRRTRVFLSQLKEALPADGAARFVAGFKAVAQRCNVLRDLDVQLLYKQAYYDMLPEHLREGLDQYFEYVARKRARHHEEFSAYLGTSTFDSLLRDWDSFLDDPASLVNDRPAIAVAGAKIRSRFERIVKRGRKIDDYSPDERLHELRIECKKLRYLLEFFSSYYPEKKMNELISNLKGFQDNLGEFNDLTVQQQDLGSCLRNSRRGGKARTRDAAIGGLLTVLNNKQVDVRKEFYKRFAAFDSPENRSLYAELFLRSKS